MNNPESPSAPPKASKFSWKLVGKIILVVVIIGALLGTGYFLFNFRPAKIAFMSLVSDDHEHYLPCEELPFLAQVQKALNQHADVVNKLKELGAFEVSAVENKCPSLGGFYFIKGDILIQYETHSQRLAIESLIGNNFFGIPWRGENH